MLYQLYEAQRSLMEPLTDFAQAASKLYSNDKSPLSHLPMAQRMAAGYDLLFRLGKDYEKPEFGIKSVKVGGSDVVIQEAIALDRPCAGVATTAVYLTTRSLLRAKLSFEGPGRGRCACDRREGPREGVRPHVRQEFLSPASLSSRLHPETGNF